jgi:hypothetical protein
MAKPPNAPSATNKVHFACFECRHSFKQLGSSNWSPDVLPRAFPCPNCKKPMVQLQRHFKAPPRRARKQWLKVELLYSFGERFVHSDSRLGQKCPTMASTVAYLIEQGNAKDVVLDRLEQIRKSHVT